MLEDVQESEAEHSGEIHQQKEQWVRSEARKHLHRGVMWQERAGQHAEPSDEPLVF